MMARYKTLPLGVDLGTTRARMALAEYAPGDLRVVAVSARDIAPDVAATPALVAALLEEMIRELGTRERRCVTALVGPESALRVVRFPKMSWQERRSAARYEAQRFVGAETDLGEATVRLHPAGSDGAFAIGMATTEVIARRVAALKAARLRVIAVDHDAFAFRRVLTLPDAVIDIGAERSSLHLYTNAPFSHHSSSGGAEVTRGIARELSIDLGSAERRKRILGAAGTGSTVRESLASELSLLVERARSRAPVTRIALTGNGARLPGLAAELEAITGAIVELPVPEILESDAYPEDVIRAAAPDWTLAAALTTWRLRA